MKNITVSLKGNPNADIIGQEFTGKGKKLNPNAYFMPLGHSDGNHYFYRKDSSHIIKATSFTVTQLLNIAPLKFWEDNYFGTRSIDWIWAQNDLIQSSIAAGPFDSHRIRGTGVWRDQSKNIVNTGEHLIVDGKKTNQADLSSYFIYVKTSKMFSDLHKNPLSAEEGKLLTGVTEAFNWQNPGDGRLLAGWVFIARIVGALTIHPHIWVTGGKGTGKSTLLGMIGKILGPEQGKLSVIGASTEAGIRQSIKCNSIPVVFDEFEQEGKRSQARIDSIIELLRSAWSTTEGKVIKGSANGDSVEYSLNFSALVSSIRVRLQNDADRSRFSVLELLTHDSNPAKAAELNAAIANITPEWAERFLSRGCSMIENIIKCQDIFSQAIAGRTSQRHGQQLGTLLAGWWCLENDGIVTGEQALRVCQDFLEFNEPEQDVTDEQECLTHLMTTAILFRTASDTFEQSIEYVIDNPEDQATPINILKTMYGIKLKDGFVLIAHRNAELSKIYRETRWADNWSLSLKRLKGALIKEGESFGGRKNKSRAVAIPANLI